MGAAGNKVFLPLLGKPLLVWTLAAFAQAPGVDGILLVAHPNELAYCRDEIVARYNIPNVSGIVAGGVTRHQSEERALDALRDDITSGAIGLVLIHDGARPLVTPEEIGRLSATAWTSGGALLAAPVAPDEVIVTVGVDTASAGLIEPQHLWRAQTPQAFAAKPLLDAYDLAQRDGFAGTDTAAVYAHAGHTVRVVPGSPANIKVTTPDDLARAEAILRARGELGSAL
jgi:2-C-methyl-D-erythritol 4-phosphate cytidylyltransferase